MSNLKRKIKKFGVTDYSDDKAFLNAIITSDATYKPKGKHSIIRYKMSMWLYAIAILSITLFSLGMLAFSKDFNKNHKVIVSVIEVVVFVVLSLDLFMRWYTSEVRMKKGNYSYFLFPITLTGMMLIASLLPSLYLINVWTKTNNDVLNHFEGMKFLRIFRIILLANLIPGMAIFRRVLVKEKKILVVVFSLVLVTILLFALVIFNIEEGVDNAGLFKGNPGFDKTTVEFSRFWDALYFSTITLTTIGFGDKAPTTDMGQFVTMVMSIIGIAVLAIPSGIIAGGFISEIKSKNK